CHGPGGDAHRQGARHRRAEEGTGPKRPRQQAGAVLQGVHQGGHQGTGEAGPRSQEETQEVIRRPRQGHSTMHLTSRPVLAAILALLCPTALPAQTTYLGKSLGDWLTQFNRGKTPAARRSAAFALGRVGSAASLALPDLARAVRDDKNAGVRDMAASAIGDIL